MGRAYLGGYLAGMAAYSSENNLLAVCRRETGTGCL
jgi:hypothetical protein